MNHASLFSGIGGLDLAAHWAGMQTVIMCEQDEFCHKVLNRHFPGVPIINDVREFTRERVDKLGIGKIDIISGGFPCQPFSHAGKRQGTADDRHLWPEMLRVIRELRPSWVFGENVDGLVSMAQSNGEIVVEDEATICEEAEMVIETIRKDLEDEGYRSIPIIIPASAIGALHRRYRVFILAYSEGRRFPEEREHFRRSEERASGDSEKDVAVSSSKRRDSINYERRSSEKGQGKRESSSTDGLCNQALANNNSQPRPQSCETIESIGGERYSWSSISGSGRRSRASTCGVTLESRMGGMPDEFSAWLDGGVNPLDKLIDFISSCPQVAPLGMEQFGWEPPRVATGIKDRVPRLKALGNAVDPLQAYPVMYGIRVLHELG